MRATGRDRVLGQDGGDAVGPVIAVIVLAVDALASNIPLACRCLTARSENKQEVEADVRYNVALIAHGLSKGPVGQS